MTDEPKTPKRVFTQRMMFTPYGTEFKRHVLPEGQKHLDDLQRSKDAHERKQIPPDEKLKETFARHVRVRNKENKKDFENDG